MRTRVSFIKLLLLSPIFLAAQKDSAKYYLALLKNNRLSDSVRASLNIQLGRWWLDRNPSNALDYSKEAYHLALKIGSLELLHHSSRNISKSLLSQGNYDSSMFYANQSFDYASKSKSVSLIYGSLNQIGNVFLDLYQLRDARKNYDEAFKIAAENPGIPNRNHIYQNLGSYYYKALDFNKGIEILTQGILIANKENDQIGLMRMYSNIGQLYAFVGKIDSSHVYLMTALDYFQKHSMKREEAIIYQKLGSIYGAVNNTIKMEENLDKAYLQFRSIGDNISAINTLLNKVNTYFRSFKLDRCLEVLNTLEPEAVKYDHQTSLGLSYIYRAGIFSLLKDTARAAQYQYLADRMSKEINTPAFDRMNAIIKSIVLSGQMKTALGDALLKKTLLNVRNEIPVNMLESSLQSVTLNKSLLNEDKIGFIKSYKAVKPEDSLNAKRVYDSLVSQPIESNINMVTNRQLLELETRYKTRQKDDSLKTQQQLLQLKNQSIETRNYFLAGLALLFFFITVLFVLSRRQSKRIRRQYSEIQQLQSELTHRTGNFFSSISGMLSAAASTTSDKETIDSLRNRVGTINRLFKTLYSSPVGNETSFETFLSSICIDFGNSFASAKRIMIHPVCTASITKAEAVPLAFIITELMTNAVKYAFEGRTSGEIHINVSQEGESRILHVCDDGRGRDEKTATRPGSQGMSIVRSYAKNLGGSITTWNDNGFHFKMIF